jgi:hypothetical protein
MAGHMFFNFFFFPATGTSSSERAVALKFCKA